MGTFVNLRSVVTQDAGEGGQMGMSFHTTYTTNGYFFVNYTTRTNGKLSFLSLQSIRPTRT
jgi:hypothetical protein